MALKKSSLCNYLSAALLIIMAVFAFASARDDSVTTDEAPHVTAGYSYLAYKDYRLNPEHPPLVKDLAALPLLFQNLNFPLEKPSWTENTNDQWTIAPQFLFESGNNPDSIIGWMRVAPIGILLILGFFVYVWTKELFGPIAALLALFLFAFSPEFLAHGRLVTTDVPAAAMFFIGTYSYLRFLKRQNSANFLIASIALAIAQLTKFSLVLLWPFLVLITLMWIIFKDPPLGLLSFQLIKKFWRYGLMFAGMALTAYILIFPLYQFHVWNYPPELQARDIQSILPGDNLRPIQKTLVWMSDKPVLRAYSQYILGVTMVFIRVEGGNTTYFLGEITNKAWWYYFPVVFALKVPLAFLLALFLAALLAFKNWWRNLQIVLRAFTVWDEKIRGIRRMIKEIGSAHFEEASMLLVVLLYWLISIKGNLNIGVRHVLPSLPFLYVLVAGQLQRWVNGGNFSVPQNFFHALRLNIISFLKKWFKLVVIAVLLLWYAAGTVSVFPFYLAYFNELAGGPDNGYKYVVDSNLDWGQDLKRLARFVEERNVQKIKLAYFGGSSPRYYLGDKFEPMYGDQGPQTGWIAISATLLQGGRGKAVQGFTQSTEHNRWLDAYQPVAKIGYSIFVYYIPE